MKPNPKLRKNRIKLAPPTEETPVEIIVRTFKEEGYKVDWVKLMFKENTEYQRNDLYNFDFKIEKYNKSKVVRFLLPMRTAYYYQNNKLILNPYVRTELVSDTGISTSRFRLQMKTHWLTVNSKPMSSMKVTGIKITKKLVPLSLIIFIDNYDQFMEDFPFKFIYREDKHSIPNPNEFFIDGEHWGVKVGKEIPEDIVNTMCYVASIINSNLLLQEPSVPLIMEYFYTSLKASKKAMKSFIQRVIGLKKDTDLPPVGDSKYSKISKLLLEIITNTYTDKRETFERKTLQPILSHIRNSTGIESFSKERLLIFKNIPEQFGLNNGSILMHITKVNTKTTTELDIPTPSDMKKVTISILPKGNGVHSHVNPFFL